MSEAATAFLGVKSAYAVASFVGSVCSLSYMTQVGKLARCGAVAVGTATGCYLGPAIARYVEAGDELAVAICWAVGFFAMSVLPAAQVLGAKIPGDVWELIRNSLGSKK